MKNQKEDKGHNDIKQTFKNIASMKNEDWDKIKENIVEKKKLAQVFQKNIHSFFDMRNLAEQFLDIHPAYYDKARNWWLWNHLDTRWERVDESDILNAVNRQSSIDTINSKNKTEIIEALKQVSRLNKPRDIKPYWIQFKDTIIDIETGETFKASPNYFVTNPIPYDLHPDNFTDTPTMDRIFEEWVGKDYVQTLYEILAYCLIPDYPIHRIFCFIGAGMNGKSCFLSLLRKFVGKQNCCSTELDSLLGSRFEITRLHKKLVCMMGETNFNEINKTSTLKKLAGGDLIGFEYKGKDHFEDVNYAKIIIATNNLPTTTDKTIGFYRRWLIVDFFNRFSEKLDILSIIPEEEYNALALKCTLILKDLLEKRAFTNEGTIEERMEKYESKSNFLEKFINEATEPNGEEWITTADFYAKFQSWCKEHRHREMSETSVGLGLKKLGLEQQRKYFNWAYGGKGGQIRCWVGIQWKK